MDQPSLVEEYNIELFVILMQKVEEEGISISLSIDVIINKDEFVADANSKVLFLKCNYKESRLRRNN